MRDHPINIEQGTLLGHSGHEDHDSGSDAHEHCHRHCHDHHPIQQADPALFRNASETRAIYRIPNMDCPMEEELIRKKLAGVPGVEDLQFNLLQRVLRVDHKPGARPQIEAALKAIDMTPEALNGQEELIAPQDAVIPWKKLLIAGILAALSEGAELASDWGLKPFGSDFFTAKIWDWPAGEVLSLVLAAAAILLGGLGTFRKGWLAISNLNLNINALMAVAVSGAACIGQFPEAAMVMVLFNISEAIEARALDRARNALKDLVSLAPDVSTVLQANGTWEETPTRTVPLDALVRIRPGEKIGLDGIVISGHSQVNQASITGESMPVEKKPGDIVYAGTINEAGSLEFRVTAAARDTTLARIIHAVEEAQATKAPMQRFVDVFAKYYTLAVFALAVLWAFIPPLFFGASWFHSVYTALVILVIGCPCALVISTPVTVVSGMARATRLGILVKGGLYLEQGRNLQALALDKTGTITYGRPALVDFRPLQDMEAAQALTIAASLASRSDHPVSAAIAREAKKRNLVLHEVESFEAIPGKGIAGIIDKKEMRLGSQAMLEGSGEQDKLAREQIEALEKEGKTAVALIGPAGVLAVMGVADEIRPESRAAILELTELGVKTIMLTGDNAYAARHMAEAAGVTDVRANLLPQDKLTIIEDLGKSGRLVGMAGDGINDSPALAKAGIGFAMAAQGTDTAIETADVALMDDDLRKIPRFVRLSRAVHAILVENIVLALGIKAIFFALTLAGLATMWMAVFADVGAALLVVANGLRVLGK